MNLPDRIPFDGRSLPPGLGVVVNATGGRMAVNTKGRGQFILRPGEGLVTTLDGLRVIRPGGQLVRQLDGSWRVSNPSIEIDGGDDAAEGDEACSPTNRPSATPYSASP